MKYCKNSLADLERIPCYKDRRGYLRLDMNENPEGIPQELFDEVISELTPEAIATYPNTARLEQILADKHQVSRKNIVITNGTDACIKYLLESLCEEGDGVLMPKPTFAMYEVDAKMYSLTPKFIRYDEQMKLDTEAFINAINSGVRIVVALNPNNPIGSVFTPDEMRRIIARAEKHDAIVIIDEAYHYFYPETYEKMALEYPNVVVLRTFSKLCSLAGLRIGYAIAHEGIITAVNRVRPTFDTNVPALLFAEKIIENPAIIRKLQQIEREGKAYLLAALNEEGIKTSVGFGNYVFIDCLGKAAEVARLLDEQKVSVKVYADIPYLAGSIRISTGSRAVMERFLTAFIPIYNGIKEKI